MSKPKVIAGKPQQELELFASWFHQDWRLVFPDFIAGAEMYISALPTARREKLRAELSALLDEYPAVKSRGLRRRWSALGAQAWQKDLDLRVTLTHFLETI